MWAPNSLRTPGRLPKKGSFEQSSKDEQNLIRYRMGREDIYISDMQGKKCKKNTSLQSNSKSRTRISDIAKQGNVF